ncbi:hydrogenase 4 subunit F [Nitrospina gracilis]|uniref:hydrogenase 4 subunit F n=1 Tax=Nitrospina gracilis TaxID=35801 RepID=UPI001F45BB16|nr:hydrogenase 4 subunit F [Nitrospina gracilis]MCF8721274.1 hydrogenase-4 component F [Nitrospina gracilis Nb-211]
MNLIDFLLGIPVLAGAAMAFLNSTGVLVRVNVAASVLTFLVSAAMVVEVWVGGPLVLHGDSFFLDAFNIFLVALTAFVGATTAVFSGPYMLHEESIGRVTPRHLRLYHVMYQLFVFGMLLALTTNNLGVLWIALELATLATVLLVSLYRTPAAISAAWKYFILCGMGIALALFGTILIFSASSEVIGHSNAALRWTVLYPHAGELTPGVITIAFAFMMVGYGTKVGLFPMHAWLPDAHGEGPTPISAVLSGLLLNVALYALVRCKALVDGATQSNLAGYLMMGFGLLSLLIAALSLHRQRDIKRLFSYSSIEHMGLMTFSFGIGTPLAIFAALLHMTVHSLVKSGIFFTVGHAAQVMRTQIMGKISGLINLQPGIGVGLLIGTVAIAGFPPFGVFTSEFLLVTAALQTHPWTVVILLPSLVVAFAGLFRHLQPMVFGTAPKGVRSMRVNMLPVYVHLGLALFLGLAIPEFLSDWFQTAADLLHREMP